MISLNSLPRKSIDSYKIAKARKWNSYINLIKADMPVPNIFLFKTKTTVHKELKKHIQLFQKHARTPFCLIRFDHSSNQAVASGTSIPINNTREILARIQYGIQQGWTPLIIELQDRCNLTYCSCATFLDSERIHIDFLGPGHDGCDFSKATIVPCVSFESKENSPGILEYINHDSLTIEHNIFEHLHFYFHKNEFMSHVNNNKRIENRIAFLKRSGLDSSSINRIQKRLSTPINISFHELKTIFIFALRFVISRLEHKESYKYQTLIFHSDIHNLFLINSYNHKCWD